MTSATLLPAKELGPEERTLSAATPIESAMGGYAFAHEVTPTLDGVFTHLRYWHRGLHPAGCSHRVILWQAGAIVVELLDHPPEGFEGYREVPLSPPIEVAAGTVYRTSYEAGFTESVASTSPPPVTSAAPNVTLTSGSFYAATGSYPSNAQSINRHVDVVYRSGTIPPPPPTHAGRPWRAVLDAIAAVPAIAELGPTFASAWVANMATPAILVVPVTRVLVRPADVRWELALQVVVSIAGDDDEALHALLEAALPAIPAGVLVGDTTYGQDERAGATYIVSTTTLTA